MAKKLNARPETEGEHFCVENTDVTSPRLLKALNEIWDNRGAGGAGLLVGNVDEDSEGFPDERPDGTPLQAGDFVAPASDATFPFEVGGITFADKTDSAMWTGSEWCYKSSPGGVSQEEFDEAVEALENADDALSEDIVEVEGALATEQGNRASADSALQADIDALEERADADETDIAELQEDTAAFVKSASVSGNTLTLINKDDTTMTFTPAGQGVTIQAQMLQSDDFWFFNITKSDVELAVQSFISGNPVRLENGSTTVPRKAFDVIAASGAGSSATALPFIIAESITTGNKPCRVKYAETASGVSVTKIPFAESGASDYDDLENRPQVNGETLTGDMSSQDLKIIAHGTSLPSGTHLGELFALTADVGSVKAGLYCYQTRSGSTAWQKIANWSEESGASQSADVELTNPSTEGMSGTATTQAEANAEFKIAIGQRESLSNKTTSIGTSVSDVKYPSEKAVKNYVDGAISAAFNALNDGPLT